MREPLRPNAEQGGQTGNTAGGRAPHYSNHRGRELKMQNYLWTFNVSHIGRAVPTTTFGNAMEF